MRDMSHRAAATLTLGLLTDDLFGALMNAPTGVVQTNPQRGPGFADYLAAGQWLAAEAAESRAERRSRLRSN